MRRYFLHRSMLMICASLMMLLDTHGQSPVDTRLQWWQDARFGMFIHWGPVSIKGTEIGWSRGNQVPVEEYDQLYQSFNPKGFSASEWVALAKAAGMKYLVLTAKHHDGFCLWDTETTDYNIMNTPFGRDVVKELSEECKRQGIVLCTYYSILDWYHPDYNIDSRGGPGYALPADQKPDIKRYNRYLKAQLKELIENYGPLGVMWFDGEWEDPWTHEMGLDLYDYVRGLQDDIIINNRVDKGRAGMEGTTRTDKEYAGDFDTPEQEVGKFQIERPWESCITIADQWAWKPNDQVKSLEECIRILVQTAGGDGNLLLNVGPMPTGLIEEEQVKRLKEIGNWLTLYGESIYETRGGPYLPAKWGVSTFKDNKIFLHLLNPDRKRLSIPSPQMAVKKCYIMHGEELAFRQSGRKLKIQLKGLDPQAIDNVVVLELDDVAR